MTVPADVSNLFTVSHVINNAQQIYKQNQFEAFNLFQHGLLLTI